MPRIASQEFMGRYSQASIRAQLWRGLFEDCYEVAIPNRNTYNGRTPAQVQNTRVFDTTAVMAVTTYISQLQVGLTPLFTKWAELDAGHEVPEVFRDNLKRQLQPATELLFRYLQNSNLNQALNESHKDLAVSTGILTCNEGMTDDKPLIFESIPLESVYLEEGPYGLINTVWRNFERMPVRNILQVWPQAQLDSSLKVQLKDDPNSTADFIESSVFDPIKKEFTYSVVHQGLNTVIFEEKSESSPWIVYRDSKMPGEVYGRGRVIEALPTIQSLQAVYEDELIAAGLRAKPIWLGFNDGVFNPWNVELEPNTVIPISPDGRGALPLQPLPLSGDVQFGQLTVQDLRMQINKIFFTEPLGEISGAQPRTATELLIRRQENLEQKEPFIGRLIVELLEPLLKRVVFILQKRKLFPQIKIDGKQISVRYKSPLLKSQNVGNVNNFVQMIQILQQTVGPEGALMGIKAENLPEYLAEQFGTDLSLIKTPDEIIALTQAAAEAQQAQEAAQQGLPTPSQVPQQPAQATGNVVPLRQSA